MGGAEGEVCGDRCDGAGVEGGVTEVGGGAEEVIFLFGVAVSLWNRWMSDRIYDLN